VANKLQERLTVRALVSPCLLTVLTILLDKVELPGGAAPHRVVALVQAAPLPAAAYELYDVPAAGRAVAVNLFN
jgi:hypothetical protein